LGIGDGGWGIGDWGLGPIPNPQSPIPNPQSPIPINPLSKLKLILILFFILKINNYFIKNNYVTPYCVIFKSTLELFEFNA